MRVLLARLVRLRLCPTATVLPGELRPWAAPATDGRTEGLVRGSVRRDLQELMTLTAQGQVTLHTTTYPLDAINDAMADLDRGRLQGRGILVPAGAN